MGESDPRLATAKPQRHAPLDERLLVRYARLRCRRAFTGFRAAKGRPRPPSDAILLYLHVPYCEQPCLYCSFHRVQFEESAASSYFGALRDEIRSYAARGFRFDSLSVGGGTPTVLPRELGRTLELARSLWPIRELTVETTPGHLRSEDLVLLRSHGVERLSVGVQSLRDDLLRALGRQVHGKAEDIRRQLERAAAIFPTVNADLIFGFPGQTVDMLAREVAEIREIGLQQVTFYPLMRSRGTERDLVRRLGGRPSDPLPELYAAILEGMGPSYRATSAWCFTRADGNSTDEYIVAREEYAGLGSGSFGYIGGKLWATTFSIPAYVEAIRQGRSPAVLVRPYSPLERWQQRLLLELFGGVLRPLELAKESLVAAAIPSAAALGFLAACGAARLERGELRTTARGRLWAVLLMKEFFQAVNDFRDACRAASLTGGGETP